MADRDRPLARLKSVLAETPDLYIAVSGGVDSMTLAHVAMQVRRRGRVVICHAISPAVPAAATARVKDHAMRHGWDLRLLEAGEFADPDYLKNPVNRCYFCKANLYDRIRQVSAGGRIASGANLDDLGDYRPGLQAASERDICHPFVEARCTKSDVRAIARDFELEDLAELPAQPCLASRIETGITVDPADLAFIEASEAALTRRAPGATLRCRIVRGGVRLELGTATRGDPSLRAALEQDMRALCRDAGRRLVSVTGYERGSAFLHG